MSASSNITPDSVANNRTGGSTGSLFASLLMSTVGAKADTPNWCNNTRVQAQGIDPCGLKQFEFDTLQAHNWMWNYRLVVGAMVSLYVLLSVDLGPRLMRDRKPFQCEWYQLVWNALLAVYSWISTYYLTAEFIDSVRQDGFFGSLCTARTYYSGETGYVVWLFHISKVIELGDTMWLVLRKRPVQFLHWYHHTSILMNAWFSYLNAGSIVRIGTYMNLCVHGVMYTYFAAQQLFRKRIPRLVALMVTTMQITQFIIGTTILVNVSYRVVYLAEQCDCDMSAMWRHIGMYVSYLILFSQFFYNSYLRPKPHVKKE